MAIEDAAVLGSLLSRLSHRAEIAPLMHAYEHLRLARATETQMQSRMSRDMLNFHDGPEQMARDAEMGAAMVAERLRVARAAEALANGMAAHPNWDAGFEGNSNQWADRTKSIEQFNYDAHAEADRAP